MIGIRFVRRFPVKGGKRPRTQGLACQTLVNLTVHRTAQKAAPRLGINPAAPARSADPEAFRAAACVIAG
jgi:hypothetical protein